MLENVQELKYTREGLSIEIGVREDGTKWCIATDSDGDPACMSEGVVRHILKLMETL